MNQFDQNNIKREATEDDLKYLFFCDFGKLVKDKENKLYEEVKDFDKLKQVNLFFG